MLTIRVYRVRPDGTRTPTLASTTVRVPEHERERQLPAVRQEFPPCRCPRCRLRAT